MLLHFFRKSFAVQYLAICITGIILWAPAWINPPVIPEPSGPVPLYELFFGLVHTLPLLASVMGFIVVLASAYILNYMFTTEELVPKSSSLTGFFFIIMMSGNPANMALTQVNIAILCLIYVLHCLLKAYNRKDPVDLAFTAGFFISFASLFYIPSILLYGFLLTGFFVYRSLNWREWVASFIGLITPMIFTASYYFLFDKMEEAVDSYRAFILPEPPSLAGVTPLFITVTGLMLLFIFVSVFRSVLHLAERTVEMRKKMIVLFWMLFWMAASIPWAKSCITIHPSLSFITIVPFVASFLLGVRKVFLWEIITWLFIAAILVQSYMMMI